MVNKLPIDTEMYNKAVIIVKRLQEENHKTVFAGGFVRDMLLNYEPKDIDIATSAKPEEVENLFDRTIPIGKKFGVITVVSGKYTFEVATFRKDSGESDGRHPDKVKFCSMEQDAQRRDFTINGMFYDPIKDKIYDFVGGVTDLDNKSIAFIGHNPIKRIEEDYLRMLRAIRFSLKYKFNTHTHYLEPVRNSAHKILNISKERITEELRKIMLVGNPKENIELLDDANLLEFVLPDIKVLQNCKQSSKWHPEGDVYKHTLKALDNIPDKTNEVAIWATLFHDVGKPGTLCTDGKGDIHNNGHEKIGAEIAHRVLKRMRFPNDFVDEVTYLVKNHMKLRNVKDFKESTLKKFVAHKYFKNLPLVCHADSMGSVGDVSWMFELNTRILNLNNVVELPPPVITGKDLIEYLELKPGPSFKNILKYVFDKQLEGEFKSKSDGLEIVEEFLKEKI